MSETSAPPPPTDPPQPPGPPEPPSEAPPPPPSGGGASGGAASENRNLWIFLAYLGPLALIPLLAEPNDKEVQWHAKHGLVFVAVEIAFCIVLSVLMAVTGGLLGCFLVPLFALALVAFLVVHVVAIIQGLNGKRFIIPYVSEWADKF